MSNTQYQSKLIQSLNLPKFPSEIKDDGQTFIRDRIDDISKNLEKLQKDTELYFKKKHD